MPLVNFESMMCFLAFDYITRIFVRRPTTLKKIGK